MIIGDADLAARTARVAPQPARFPRNPFAQLMGAQDLLA